MVNGDARLKRSRSEGPGWLRVARPLGLLVLFVAVIRGLPQQARSASTSVDCAQLPPGSDDIAVLEQCVALDPNDVEQVMDLGRAYERAQQFDRAEAAYRRALTSDPDDGDAHVRLGEMLLRRGDKPGAAREGAAALKIQLRSPAAQDLIRRAQ
jgi:cytochrome c-type biogenesis protein CcmH/NrfG